MSAHVHDVLVVGAGPAGALAAYELASGGLDVALIDRATLPRYKTCGGGVVGRALRALPPELAAPFETACSRAELHVAMPGRAPLAFAVDGDAPLVSLAMRATFDHALVELARARGARAIDGCELRGLRRERDCLVATTSRGELRAKLVVGADGATGSTARLAGFERSPAGAPALEWEVRVPEDVQRRFASAVRFDFGWVARGYCWVFPKAAHLSVGALSTERGAKDLDAALTRYLDEIGCAPRLSVERHGYVIPLAPRRDGFVRDRVFLIGDAAGLADPLTAEGISHALISGRAIARACIEGELQPSRVTASYARALEREVLAELRWAARLARVLYRDPPPRGLFERAGGELCRAMALTISGERRYRDLLLDPANLLRLVIRWVDPRLANDRNRGVRLP